MAAREPEMKLIADDTKAMVRNAAVLEEKESCGSNEVSSLFEFSNSLPKNLPKPTNKPRNLAKRSFSRQSSTSSHLTPKESKVHSKQKFFKKICIYLFIIYIEFFEVIIDSRM